MKELTRVCRKILFQDRPFTYEWFVRESKTKIPRAVVKRIVAFLSVLPKNMAFFQALEPVFEYVFGEFFELNKDEQRYILFIEKIEHKFILEEYELVTGVSALFNYSNMFCESFRTKLQKEERRINICENLFPLIKFVGDLWRDYHDKKGIEYELHAKCFDGKEEVSLNIFSGLKFENFEEMGRAIVRTGKNINLKIIEIEVTFGLSRLNEIKNFQSENFENLFK